ncbi:MAG: hypothetical protein IJ318_00805 [Clostridia bacterium]|nr:hypothetical protein [Clostridia bacterium]
MAEEKIKLSWELSTLVWQALEKKGVPKRARYGLVDTAFSQEELDLVTHLSLKNHSGSLKGLSYLRNLTSLSIVTTGNTSYKASRDLQSIKDSDIFEIEKLSNLKHLTINNQRLITTLDISRMSKLETLELTRNEELTEVIGLAQNRTIGSLTLYDSNNLLPIKNFDQFIAENANLYETNLDVLLFPQAIGFKTATGATNEQALAKLKDIDLFCHWTETCGNNTIKITNAQMQQLHKKALEVVTTHCKGLTELDTVAMVDAWLAKNVKYNYDALESNLRGQKSEGGIILGPARGANGTYNAFMYNCCVCEGYTRAMQYMLALKGIHTSNTSCIAGEDTLHMSEASTDSEYTFITLPQTGYHSICRIDRPGGIYYCDPCWDACSYQRGDHSLPYLLLSKAEISKDHTLSYNEKNISHQAPIPSHILSESKSRAVARMNQHSR